MRILMLGWEFPPAASGGLGTACEGIVDGLAGAGAEIVFVLPRTGEDSAREGVRFVGARSPRSHEGADPPHPSVRLLEVRSPLRPYMTERTYAGRASSTNAPGALYGDDLAAEVRRYAGAVRELARDESFDVIHAHDWMTVPAALAAKEVSGAPLVLHVHACEHDRNPGRPDSRIRAVEQAGLDAADRVVAVSRFTAGALRRRYRVEPGKLRVVHNAVERPAATTPRTANGPPLVLFLGRVTRQKGPDLFLEAAARVHRAEPDARFVVTGSGDMLPLLIERAARTGLGRHVHFTGFLSGDELERMYARATVFVLPSMSEPFGIAVLEAAARGIPVVVSKQSGVVEVLESSWQVDYWDVAGLAEAILVLLRRPDLRARQAAACGRELAAARWEARAEELLGVYRELVA